MVQLTRMAGLLTLFGGIILLVAANAVVGVCIILLSALYFALAEIIGYLAIIAHDSSCSPERQSDEMEHQLNIPL